MMQNDSFKHWLNKNFKEWADFGFDKQKSWVPPKDLRDTPIPPHKINYIIESLRKVKLGIKEAKKWDFNSSAKWGEGNGAISVDIAPFGSLSASIRKQTNDMRGVPTPICKKVIQIWDYEDPDKVIQQIYETLIEVDKENTPSPIREYQNLEKLAILITNKINRFAKTNILMFEGIRIVEPTRNYIIHYGVTGMGRQKRGQKRVDQIQIQLKYEADRGLIKIVGNEIGDHIGKHSWQFDPSEFNEYFSPAQDKEEIADAILNHVSSTYCCP